MYNVCRTSTEPTLDACNAVVGSGPLHAIIVSTDLKGIFGADERCVPWSFGPTVLHVSTAVRKLNQ